MPENRRNRVKKIVKGKFKDSKPKFPKYGPDEKERQIRDVLQALREDWNQTRIAKTFDIGERSLIKEVRWALKSELLIISHSIPASLEKFLQDAFPQVKFRIIGEKYGFEKVASRWLLAVLRESYNEIPKNELFSGGFKRLEAPFVAVGGGRTIAAICQEVKSALVAPESKDCSEWLREKRFCITNATAGGSPWEPRSEASKLACDLGTALAQDVGVYSVSRLASNSEKELIRAAVTNTFLVVSGVGTPGDAQCLNSMLETGFIQKADYEGVVGEFLYYPYKSNCHPVVNSQTPWFDIKEHIVYDPVPEQIASSPLMASLFSFETLKGSRSNSKLRKTWPYHVAAVAKCNEENRTAKAKSLFYLLANGYLSHVCIPIDLLLELRKVAESHGDR